MVRLRRPGRALPRNLDAVASKLQDAAALRREPAPAGGALRADRARTRAASPRPSRSRARSSATTISTTPMPRSSWSPSSATAAPTVVIVKHANPCGVASARHAARGLERGAGLRQRLGVRRDRRGQPPARRRRPPKRSRRSSPRSWSRPTPTRTPSAIFARKKNLRLLLTGELPDPARGGQTLAVIAGGLLVQDRDNGRVTRDQLKVRHQAPADRAGTRRLPVRLDRRQARQVERHRLCQGRRHRRHRRRPDEPPRQRPHRRGRRSEAAETNGWPEPRTVGSAVASDAFFPFADGLLAAVEAGATAVIQPGGSIRDDEVIAAADEAGLAMVFTGMRHFRH